jgi:hypothetical protein
LDRFDRQFDELSVSKASGDEIKDARGIAKLPKNLHFKVIASSTKHKNLLTSSLNLLIFPT